MSLPGQLLYFRSAIDGLLCPYAACATDASDTPKPLVVEVTPGALDNLPRAIAQAEEVVEIAARTGKACVAIRPTGRGGGSVYQNYGEIDVLEAIAHARSVLAIDPDRIVVTGTSMGGAAVWYLASHYPDLFAAAAPFDGYSDYRLWEKPGGHTFHLNDWEIPSWRSRSAAFLADNFADTPVWIVQGEWDRAIGGGVSIEHSRQMARLLAERGYVHRFTELPRTSHGSRTPEMLAEIIPWLLDQTKTREPTRASLTTYGLRHNRIGPARLLQLARYGETPGTLRLDMDRTVRMTVETSGVRTFALNPLGSAGETEVTVDGTRFGPLDLRQLQTFRRAEDGVWQTGAVDLTAEKRPGASGPIGDMFFDRTILVPGTSGTEEETLFNDWVATHAQGFYKARNGGVHRGGILGVNAVDLAVVKDRDCKAEMVENCNLLLFGTDRSNALLAEMKRQLLIEFGHGAVRVWNKTFEGPKAAVIAVFPHPRNPARYVGVHGGVTPDAISWGSHLDLNLLPDYLAYSEGTVLGWGFCDNRWNVQA